MTVSLDEMAVNNIAPVVAAQEILGENGEVHLAAMRVWPQRVSETRSGTRRKMASSWASKMTGAGPIICAMVRRRSSRPAKCRCPFRSAI
jgi:hypothetical protein